MVFPVAVSIEWLVLEQLRRQRHFIGCDVPELQLFHRILIVCLHSHLIGRTAAQFLPGGIVDVVDTLPDIPLGKIGEYGPFRQDHDFIVHENGSFGVIIYPEAL